MPARQIESVGIRPVMASRPTSLTPSTTVFVLVSFEGVDRYSQAGGLGTRVTGLAHTLAQLGYETHLFFIGDPTLPATDALEGGRLILHRWGQWISAHHPSGVYDGEEGKRRDLTASLPGYLLAEIIAPALARGQVPVVLSEEWQTAEFASVLAERLSSTGLRDGSVLFWNANNPYSFERIDWPRLGAANTLTTVSRYMRSIMRAWGADAIVVPNGIPRRLVRNAHQAAVAPLRAGFAGRRTFFKMARWAPEKGWAQALDAVAALRQRGHPVALLARSGGPAGQDGGVAAEARARGLHAIELTDPGSLAAQLDLIGRTEADVISLRFGVTEALARVLFTAADGVLANSVSEPFGLVGLEAMAAGGVVFTGGTGEDYAIPGHNALVLETLDPREIAERIETLERRPATSRRLRRAARSTARRYTWETVARLLISHVEQEARRRELLADAGEAADPTPAAP